MQYVYRKYGRDPAAITGVNTSYRSRSFLRDVGKAQGSARDGRAPKTAYGTERQWIAYAWLVECGLDPATRLARL